VLAGWWAVAVLAAAGCAPSDRAASSIDTEEALRARAALLQPEVERLSGLPARAPLRLGIRSSADLEAFLQEELAEQFEGDRVLHLTRVYARLGLVPADLDLEPLLGRLLLEQVVGFYDPATDTLFVVDGVSPDLVDGVLVHEMVHALQDQYVDLDSLVRATRDANDAGMAVQAALEGHATYVMVEWMMGQLGLPVDLTQGPLLGETLGDNPLGALGTEMPELESAPAIIRQQLLFPYVAGLDFVQVRWRDQSGRTPPLGDNLAMTTEQVLHPREFGTDRTRPPAPLRFDRQIPDEWSDVYQDGLGEFDIRLFLREFLAAREAADEAAAGWDGDRYRLLEGPSGESLVWISRWDTPADAAQFADAARRAFRVRYEGDEGRSVSVRRLGERIVRIEDVPTQLRPGLPPAAVSYSEH
jgi:hypothetical protein